METILIIVLILWIGSIITSRRIGIADLIIVPVLVYFIIKS